MRPSGGLTFGGRYQLSTRVAIGGMGEVWEATDLVIGRTVAIKILKDEYLGDPGFLERFRAEARHAALVNHEGIANVFDYGEEEGSAYLVMELVPGEAMSTVLERDRVLPTDKVLDIVAQTASALQAAHAAGLVHRDIKPGNLLVTAGARLKIGDFGVARIDSSTLTLAGAMIGTPSYMSPEQFRGDAVDGRSDVFSSGVVLYQLLTGARPFAGSTSVVMQQILNQQPAPPSSALVALGPRFDAVLARALAKSPEQRYATARAFLDDLLAAAEGDPDATRLSNADSDSDRTMLAAGLPSAPAPRTQDTSTSPGAGNSAIVTLTPWKRAAFPDIEALLARQIGPISRFLLKKAGDKADSFDALAALLLPHVPSDLGRVQFQQALAQLKNKLEASGSGTGDHHHPADSRAGATAGASAPALGYDEAFADAVALKLVAIIGPIGRVLVKRAMKNTADRKAFLQLVAGQIDNPRERERFQAGAGALPP